MSRPLDNGQKLSKIILSYLIGHMDHWTKEIFLGYGGDKEFIIKSYVDASFYTNLDDSKSLIEAKVSQCFDEMVDVVFCGSRL